MSANDMILLKRYSQNSSEEAFAELVTRYAALVYGVSFRCLQDHGLAEDASQTVFVRLAQAAPGLDEKIHLAGWLYQTARHVALAMARARNRQLRRDWNNAMMTPEDQPENACLKSASAEIDLAMAQLDDRESEVLLLRFYRGMKYRELAANVGISEAAAKMRLARALERLHGILRTRGVECPVVAMGSLLGALFFGTPPKALALSILEHLKARGILSGSVHIPLQATPSIWHATKPIHAIGLAAICALGITLYYQRANHAGLMTSNQREARKSLAGKAQRPIGIGVAHALALNRATWSPEQWELWRALTSPFSQPSGEPSDPEKQGSNGTNSFKRFSKDGFARTSHFKRVATSLSPFANMPAPAFAVLRESLRSSDPFIQEESVRALGYLGRGSEPMLDTVLQMMAGGELNNIHTSVLIDTLPKMGEPDVVVNKLVDYLKQADRPAYDAARISLLQVIRLKQRFVEDCMSSFVDLAHEDNLKVRLTGLGLLGLCCDTPHGADLIRAANPGLYELLPLLNIATREKFLDEMQPAEDSGNAETEGANKLAWMANAKKALKSLDQDPASTADALREMLQAASAEQDKKWILSALTVLDPDAANDPAVLQQATRVQSLDSFKDRAKSGKASLEELVSAMRDKETISEACNALSLMGAGAKNCVPSLVSQLGTWRDYFIFKTLREIEPTAIAGGLKLGQSAGEAAAALEELGASGEWALPALREALLTAPPEQTNRIASAIREIETASGR